MKPNSNLVIFILLAIALTFSSCRQEETEFIEGPTEQTLDPNSTVAQLMQRTALNDGSNDNIIDQANCFNIQLPFTVIVNGEVIEITSEDDLDEVEDILDEFTDDDDEIEINYPITIILADFTEIVINNEAELLAYASACNDENEIDDDIECLDFQYPITASIFNTNSELIDTVTINNDEDLYDFIDDLDENVIASIDFPITVILFDGTEITVNNLTDLANVIQQYGDDCDEDDDYDYNDDDCDNCSPNQLVDLLTGCSNWFIDKLERNDQDLEDNYAGYNFNFFADGTIEVTWGGITDYGTYTTNGSGNNITVSINIPALPDCNADWILHEIEEEPGEADVDLRLGDDRLRFESDCNGGGNVDDSALVNALTNGDWYVTYFFDDTDETTDFMDYVFNFNPDQTATATDSGGTTNGNWSTGSGDETNLELNLNFGANVPLDELTDDWDVLEVTDNIIRLKDVSGGDGSEDFLTFERTPFDGGNGNDDLVNILSDGLWFVASYIEDTDDQTSTYNGYELNFDIAGTVVASNGSNTNNGTWQVLSGGNQMALDFGTDLPFEEFNDDDWDVISVSETEVIIQDVSGGNGGTDTLTLQKI